MKVLITPLGSTPGSLQTALEHTHPDLVHVVTSADMWSKHSFGLMYQHPAVHWRVLILRDPFAGFLEGRFYARLLSGQYRHHQITVNLTGGTTALQDCVRNISLLTQAKEIATTFHAEGHAQVHVLRPALEVEPAFAYHGHAGMTKEEVQV